MIIKRYQKDLKNIWDNFVINSKNGTFMLQRDYMDYHSDRFVDHSLMFYDEKNNLMALLPANIKDNVLYSHQGLTYGGFVTDNKMTTPKMLVIFDEFQHYMHDNSINKTVYKRIPSIYHKYPSDEDLYALFRINAKLIRRDVSTSIYLADRIKFNERRKRNIKKAIKNNLEFKQTDDYENYLNILSDVLKKQYNTKPVHNLSELLYLRNKFPENIKLYASFKDNDMLAGVLIYETPDVAHAQYIANSFEGRECGALDFIFDKLINEIYTNKIYFDFGISTEQDGKYLNEGLITQKQEFGGRAIVHDFYEIYTNKD